MAFSRFAPFALLALIFLAAVSFPGLSAAQDMDTIEGVYRQQYEQYTAQEAALQQQIDALLSQKAQVDGLISQITGTATQNYAQEAERYRQLQLLLPSAIQYSNDLAQREGSDPGAAEEGAAEGSHPRATEHPTHLVDAVRGARRRLSVVPACERSVSPSLFHAQAQRRLPWGKGAGQFRGAAR